LSSSRCRPSRRLRPWKIKFLLTPEAWAPAKLEFCHLVGKPAEAADALAQADDELHTALADLETPLAKGDPGVIAVRCGSPTTGG
jgi:hypothetical protein